VPVPRVHALCEDDSVIGSAFYVMEFLDGRIFWEQSLPELMPTERAAMFDSMNAVIAALHSVDYDAVGLGDFGRPGNYMGRQIARWSRQYRASETEAIAAMDALIDWLPQHLPEEGAPAIVHGDYRMDNLVFHKTEPRVIGILDWEFYMVYSLFRIAAIVQGIAKRAIEGTAASQEAVEIGRLARPFAEQAWTLARSLDGQG